MFTLEALDANQGDCLFLHFGTNNDRQLIMIDGGPKQKHPVFNAVVKPRLEQIASNLGIALPIVVTLLMVSHIDDDHIGGVLMLMDHANNANNPLVTVEALWHNSFDDFLGTHELDALASFGASPAAASFNDSTLKMAAGVTQGVALRKKAADLGIVANAGTEAGFVSAGDGFQIGLLNMKIIGPAKEELEALQSKWDHENPAAASLSVSARLNALAAFTDDSIANLSSIVVYVEHSGKTMLLTGDARGDNILHGLRSANLLADGSIDLDILKVPHHGSDRNVSTDFFRTVKANHYVISADGLNDNPDIATLQMIVTARGDSAYTMWFTHELPKITAFFEQDRASNNRHYEVKFRANNAKSLVVNLEEPLNF